MYMLLQTKAERTVFVVERQHRWCQAVSLRSREADGTLGLQLLDRRHSCFYMSLSNKALLYAHEKLNLDMTAALPSGEGISYS